LCLPDADQTKEISGTLDNDGKGVSIASANPNLRIMGARQATINGEPFFGFAIGFGLPFVQFVEYQGRWFLRDGYHRSYGLLRRGVRHIPCLFIRARDAQQSGGTAPHFFRGEILFGRRPPFLKDFLSDDVAVDAQRSVTGKVVRITAQEFNI
jgi:hypothetical protein